MFRIFNREPSAALAILGSALAVLLSFGLFDLSAERVGLFMAASTAGLSLVAAYYTKHFTLGVLLAFANALIGLSAGYGLTLTEAQTGALLAVTTAVVGFFQRSQTSPAEVPAFSDEGTGTE